MTRWLAVGLLLASASVSAGPRPKKQPPPKPPPAAAPDTPPPPPTESRRPAPSKGPFEDTQIALALGAGGFLGSGFNRGPAASTAVTFTPSFAQRRFALDVELGWRMASFTTPVEGYGSLTSTLHSFPLTPAIRFSLLQGGPVRLDLRAGIGALLNLHVLSTTYDDGAIRTTFGWEGFGGAQVRIPISEIELMLDAKVVLGEAPIPRVIGTSGAFQGLVGVRYPLP